jgi:hypothetical protein
MFFLTNSLCFEGETDTEFYLCKLNETSMNSLLKIVACLGRVTGGRRDGERRESKRANKAENEKQDNRNCFGVFLCLFSFQRLFHKFKQP